MSALPDRSTLPDSLLAHDQWLRWRGQERDGKPTKIPIDPSTGSFGSATDPDTWSTFDDARNYAESGDATGLGFVFTDEDPFVGVDLEEENAALREELENERERREALEERVAELGSRSLFGRVKRRFGSEED